MTDFGKLVDYKTCDYIRQATPAEWRKTADALRTDCYGAWTDERGVAVYVDGGPDPEVNAGHIAGLRDAAGAHGDAEMVTICRRALADNDHSASDWDECARVILDTRMEMA